jgi:hypothetical protein|tara:strand:+ start:16455 stop:16730 length:276 start_codon:yes stop_codon:yes gene_type:complete
MKSDERQKKESTPWITQTFDPKSEQRVRVPVFGETWCRAMPAEDALITLETRAETLGKVTARPDANTAGCVSFESVCCLPALGANDWTTTP